MKLSNLLIFLVCSLMTSCSSQSIFDFSKIKMPLDASEVLKPDFQVKKSKLKLDKLSRYTSEDKNMFVFDKITFLKSFSDEYQSSTSVEFFIDDNLGQVLGAHLKTFDDKNGRELYKRIQELFGAPNYYNKNEDFFNGAWEVDNTLFLLKQNYTTKIGGIQTMSSNLIVLRYEKEELINHFLFEGFSKYLDYIHARKEVKEQKKYTYLDFVKNQEDDFFGKNKYQEELENNLPL
ncbi:hypothetical protein ACFSTE_07180 [Aquimarina hainanensis]|uniref:Lipoprotein n=1 Tax=Aquimarina hainanensis TaxID=1578017 RepID=A0ABW5N4Z9_9FLAO|nr:hypothetical protein [Aquimarina sp. TRL1]QKX05027.1 hypothetical protein HN014_08895 [Aquimarina sp. TRL1]